MSSPASDRYVTFQGLNCDDNAERILQTVQGCLAASRPVTPWQNYFRLKLDQRQALGQDALFFVGSQISQIRELLETYDETDALQLLEQVEEECC